MNNVLHNMIEWITRFAYLNLLWIGFTLAGGVLFGFFPATVAMFAVIRGWIRNGPVSPLFPSFFGYYKKEFWKSNRMGFSIFFALFLLVLDIRYFQLKMDELISGAHILLFSFTLFFLFILFYLFPVYVHYQLGVAGVMKQALLIMIIHPLHTLAILIGLGSFFYIMFLFPALAVFFGGSTSAFVTMWISLNAFDRLQRKQAR
ncbi:YesL family protein [Bacillus sp. KH172YL63]|uniref:YesL family protein n=1 Tax=Bacillus sp. KH172YL63 TaxID=2709784 RepID=UPI0013E49F9B|nr:DUF624 domain-containing protein [Bacillus sp. KH172YL63]BCB02516.1 hypothetical protein KH172YL63_06490 [Bacillus sp. KH172YL63]